MEIRDARPADADLLAGLHRRASLVWDEDRAALLAHPELFGVPDDVIAEGRVRIALVDDVPVGFAVVVPLRAGVLELDGLFVEPDHMRRGIGRRLVADVETRATAIGITRIEVTANLQARRFYEACGYAGQNLVPTRFRPALRMHHDLPTHHDRKAHDALG